jgi:hypothetical protein
VLIDFERFVIDRYWRRSGLGRLAAEFQVDEGLSDGVRAIARGAGIARVSRSREVEGGGIGRSERFEGDEFFDLIRRVNRVFVDLRDSSFSRR